MPLTPKLIIEGPKSRPLDSLLKKDHAWYRYMQAQGDDLREAELENVTKALSCGTAAFGVREFACSNQHCANPRCISLTCNSKFCPRCGSKATDQWIATQNAILPDCSYQHAVFTLPTEICQLFEPNGNRWLLNQLSRCAAKALKTLAKKRGVTVGIFTAIHKRLAIMFCTIPISADRQRCGWHWIHRYSKTYWQAA